MKITLRSEKTTEFNPLPKQWVIERSFAWPGDFGRLAKNCERTVESSENMVRISFIALTTKFL